MLISQGGYLRSYEVIYDGLVGSVPTSNKPEVPANTNNQIYFLITD